MTIIETERLILRQWKESDRKIFSELNADPENMKFFPRPFNEEESHSFIDKTIEIIDRDGYGLFAIVVKETNQFIGFTGLAVPSYETHFTPCTEIGWRIHKDFWGKGFATEAARGVLEFAFNTLQLNEIVSFTSHFNTPSINVMKRIGMIHDQNGDFDHPRVEEGHKLRPHVLYRITSEDFSNLLSSS